MNTLLSLLTVLSLFSCGKGEAVAEDKNPAVPSNVILHSYGDTYLRFQWDEVKGADKYEWLLYRQETLVKEGTSTSRNATVSSLVKGTTYRFAVRSVKGTKVSDYCPFVEAVAGGQGEDPGTGEEEEDISSLSATEKYALFKIPYHEEDGVARAFPGAEGGGMYVTGGREGTVYHVTTLEDNGNDNNPVEGSLRWALRKNGKRTIVFDVAGTIALESTLNVSKGDVTIAGQTAPGDGICLKNFAMRVNASNVIIRFLRFRMGDERQNEDDAIWGRYFDNIILDHCSMSWSTDECASFYGNENFTMQWCILTESLTISVHGKGTHGYGGIWGGKNASFHHNLLANHSNRTPRFDHPMIYENPSNPARRGNVDYRNNVNYNWGSGNGCYGGEGAWINMVGNYYKPGAASGDRHYFIEADGVYKEEVKDASGHKTGEVVYHAYGFPHLYMEGNVHTGYADISADNNQGIYWKAINGNRGSDGTEIDESLCILSSPLSITAGGRTAYTTTHTAAKAFEKVLGNAGAALARDAVDQRAVTDATNGYPTFNAGGKGSTGGIIDTQSAVGGWPEYSATASQISRSSLDADGDGIPDWFEDKFSLDKNSASDARAKTLDIHGRYTNLEMYLHYLVRDIVAAQVTEGTYKEL